MQATIPTISPLEAGDLAPVLISVYNRLDSLKEAIDHLGKCALADKTTVYIFSDAAYRSEDVLAVLEIRDYIFSLANDKRFLKVVPLTWAKNKGSHESFLSSQEFLYSRYEKLIIFEDDIRVAPVFLQYMNEALNKYKNDKRIFSISSHNHPSITKPSNYDGDIFLLNAYSPWGVGTWKDRFIKMNWREDKHKAVARFLADPMLKSRSKKIIPHLNPMLEQMLSENKFYGDCIISTEMIKNQWLSIFPFKTLSVNRGFDGSGEHCGVDDFWMKQELYNLKPMLIDSPKLQLDPAVEKQMQRAFYHFKSQTLIPILKKMGIYSISRKFYKKLIKPLIYRA